MVDETDKLILTAIGKNARMSSQNIADYLKEFGHEISGRAVRQRLDRLERKNVVLGYTAIINPSIISEKINRTILLKFKYTPKTRKLTESLIKYLNESNSCIYSSKLDGDFSWICHFVTESVVQYNRESDSFLNKFTELISDYRSYESKMTKLSSYKIHEKEELKEKKAQVYEILNLLKKYDDVNQRLKAITDSVVKYFDGYFVRLWFIDQSRKWLLLKYASGKYTEIDGEYSKISINTLKIGEVARTEKPLWTNYTADNPRVKFPKWVEKDELKSFAAYPLMHKGKAIAVLAIFSKKTQNNMDFEILGIFCDQLSKELSGFFEVKDFLSE